MEIQRCRFDPWVRKIPWRREWHPASSHVAGKIPRGSQKCQTPLSDSTTVALALLLVLQGHVWLVAPAPESLAQDSPTTAVGWHHPRARLLQTKASLPLASSVAPCRCHRAVGPGPLGTSSAAGILTKPETLPVGFVLAETPLAPPWKLECSARSPPAVAWWLHTPVPSLRRVGRPWGSWSPQGTELWTPTAMTGCSLTRPQCLSRPMSRPLCPPSCFLESPPDKTLELNFSLEDLLLAEPMEDSTSDVCASIDHHKRR